jgi:peptide/nickel transport system permease protein
MRFVRNGLLDALQRDYTRAARARGLTPYGVLLRHALRPTLRPVAQWLGLGLPALVSGSLVIEVIFAWPGMGRATYEAIRAQDHSVVLASTLVVSVIAVAGSLAADLATAAIDPRIRVRWTRPAAP